MYHLHLALPDLAVSDLDAAAPALARLPVLEGLLARADRRAADPDWRRWVLSLAGVAVPAGDLPVARTLAARAGLDLSVAPCWLLATPVGLVPGLSSVHFDPAGPVTLAPATAEALAAKFAADFADPALALVPLDGLLLLRSAAPFRVRTHDPAGLAGLGLATGRPEGEDAGRLERLMTELQMWLHEQPLPGIDGRSANALWLWGGGAGSLAPCGRWPALACEDVFLQAAARDADPDTSRLVDAYSVGELVRAGSSFAAADERWFAPLAARLRDGEVVTAEIHCAGRVHSLSHGQRWRRWRRTRPWWEQLR